MAFSYRQKLFISITLILTIAIPITTAHRRRSRRSQHDSFSDSVPDSEQCLRDLCSDTERPDVCSTILKSESNRFENSDDRDVAGGVIDLAIARSNEIRDTLEQWFTDSTDDSVKDKYRTCSENYGDVGRNLEEARRSLDSDDYRRISVGVADGEDELEKCRREFETESFDPGHVADRVSEIRVYLDMVKAAADRLEDSYDI